LFGEAPAPIPNANGRASACAAVCFGAGQYWRSL